MRELYQNQAASAMVYFASAGEHITGVTGINSVTASASKDGAAFALITATASAERGVGWYNFTLNTGWVDTLGDFVMNISAASSDPVDIKFNIVSPRALATATDNLDVLLSSRFAATGALTGTVSAVHATATQVTDKTGYSILSTNLTGVTATLVSDKTGYSILSTNLTGVTATQVTDKTGYSILSTNLTGVTATQVSDKTGYSLAADQSGVTVGYLSNVVSAVHATATQVSDKTGYALTAAYDLAKTAAQASAVANVALASAVASVALASAVSILATSAVQQQISATAVNCLDFLGGTFTVDPVASAATAFRMDGSTTLKAWTLSAATNASAVPAFIKRTV